VTNVASPARLNLEPNLITLAQKGDASAFGALFDCHKSRVYAICLRMTNNPAEAEDLTQDAFIHVFRKLSTFRGDSAFSTWLYRIAVNTVLMHFRRRNGQQISLELPSQTDADCPRREYGGCDDELTGSIDRLALARAITELPDGYRMIFLLHEVKGYEHKEIAKLLHCSVGNSKSQLHKAKLRMRKLLATHRGHDQGTAPSAGDAPRQQNPAGLPLLLRAKRMTAARRLRYATQERTRNRKATRVLAKLLTLPAAAIRQNDAALAERVS